MLRKIFLLAFVLIFSITSAQIFSSTAFGDSEIEEEIIVGEEPYLTIDFVKAISLDNVGLTIDCKDVESIKGTYIIDGETISYEYRNLNNLENNEVIKNVKEHTEEVITGILNDKSGMFPKYNNVNAKEIAKNMNIKKIKTNGKKDVELLKNQLKNKENIKFSKYYRKITKIKDNDEEKKYKEKNTNFISSIFNPITIHAEPKGGDSQGGTLNPLQHLTKSPYKGDRQDRLGLMKRKNGSQYNWLPTKYWVDVFEVPDRTDYRRQVNIGFEFNETRLGNLNIDDNETFEAEVNFYNYGWDESLPDGHAYIHDKQYFAHNIDEENAYPYDDTRYGDTEKSKYIGNDSNGNGLSRVELMEPSYCIGVADTRKLVKDKKYWCVMQGYPYHYYDANGNTYHPAKGHAQLTFQRGYNYINPTLTSAGHPSDGHDTWSSFNEENESFIRPLKYRDTVVPKRYELNIEDDAVYIKRSK